MSTSLFSRTPQVAVLDNRGLPVRELQYHRHPDTPDVTRERITRIRYDARGFLQQTADPRLHEAGLANFTYLTGLDGSVLRTQGADNGTLVSLNDAAGRPFIAVSNVRTAGDGTEDRSQAVTRTWQYEDAALPGRPLSVTEQVTGEAARVTDRFVYAGNTDAEKALNLAGTCVSQYDTAGLVQTDSVALTGVPLSVTRRLLKGADNPDTVADWQGADVSAWNDLLDGDARTTLSTADATGAVLTTTDARGNLQRVAYDVAGLLSGSWLTVKGGTEQVIVASLTYSAAGQKLREEHGNGVVTTYEYEPETQRLTGIRTERPAGHVSGAKVLQDLRYGYDPVGNVLTVSNDAEETRFWRNQKVVPENTYAYDSLYQLVSATGREMADAAQQGSSLPSPAVPLPTDSTAYTRYTRTYTYDSAGNLTQIRHSAPATNNSYTTNITVSDRSNRAVPGALTETPSGVEALFTAGGQQTQLQPGQGLVWTARNELLKVTPVVRDGGTDDRESYRYDAESQRILKVSTQKTGSSTQTQRVQYLPGLELRSTKAGDAETESLEVITVGEAGRAQVRMLHWTGGKPDAISNDQVRYSYDNLTGSSSLELDGDGNIISMEEYYPYGGTAVWTVRSAMEADYKTVRYSGKERDATGLYYYGYRYYQPWAGRWLSADPAGVV
ncbi:RHS repeat domain-containing protein, partial [Photorhabdus australis]|uniref:RHS repeat domain-containing protein n=1 Tax=Photorhabdus australis TaxID=286156 RepID=UPI00056C48E3